MPTKIEKDVLSGQDTTGHEWDGIKELNTPLPTWWVYTFYVTIVFAVVYCALYPSWPWFTGHTQGLHVHPNANVSGVYYVTAPQAALGPGDAGKISFYDPRPRATMAQLPFQATRHRIAPVPGDMYLCPAWLEHAVSAFQGEGERICIAFNGKLVLE